jgi:hypothetical protein
MLDFPPDAIGETILEGIKQWVGLLAQERYDEAVRWLYRPPTTGTIWTPSLLQSLVTNYGLTEPRGDGKTYRVTPHAAAKRRRGGHPYRDVDWFPPGSAQVNRGVVAAVTFDLPLNGEWSDVTAAFLIHKVNDRLLVELEDMHVL